LKVESFRFASLAIAATISGDTGNQKSFARMVFAVMLASETMTSGQLAYSGFLRYCFSSWP
jgi:hypothetical protein